jgi:cation diffusion facilitator family transporter
MNRFSATKKVSILGILANLFLFIIKIIFALISKSQGMLADSINSASDVFTSFMTYVGNKLASKEKDKDHPYGHGKIEYVFSLIISICMLFLALNILINAFSSIINKQILIYNESLIYVCIITIVTKIIMFIYVRKVGKKYENLLIVAASEDHRNDVILTISTLLGIIASKYNYYFIDGIVGILISLWIVYIAIKLFKSAYEVLIDTENEVVKNNAIILINKENLCDIDDIKTLPVGINYILLIEISVDKNLTIEEGHKIAEDLKIRMCDLDKVVDTVIHVNV